MGFFTKKPKPHVDNTPRFMDEKEITEFCTEKAEPIGKKSVDLKKNIIISKDLFLSPDERSTHLVTNIMIAARAGAGKLTGFIEPNVAQNFASQIITDPSGEMYSKYAKKKEEEGYTVKCLNLSNLREGNKYNPFEYIESEKDVDHLVQCLFDNLLDPDIKDADSFWQGTAKLLLKSVILYLWSTMPKEKQTFREVLKLLNMARKDDDSDEQSPLDVLFSDLEKNDPDNIAVQRYRELKTGAEKTLNGSLTTVSSMLKMFELSDLQDLTSSDEMDLTHFADTKHAIFVVIPVCENGAYNFVASMLYTQIYQIIYRYGEKRSVPMQLIMDEFSSTGIIPAFVDKISTARAYGVTTIIALQSYTQLEDMYKDEAPIILSNCPIKALMGTSDEKTVKMFNYHNDLITMDMVMNLDLEHMYVIIDELNPYYGEKYFINKNE